MWNRIREWSNYHFGHYNGNKTSAVSQSNEIKKKSSHIPQLKECANLAVWYSVDEHATLLIIIT